MAGSGSRALVIGVDRYPRLPARSQLTGCVNDAIAVHSFLVERLGIPLDRIELALSVAEGRAAPACREATAELVRAAFTSLVAAAQPDDEVIVYFAGHGARISHATTGEYLHGFAPADVILGTSGPANLILGRELHALARALIERGAQPTLIADACHSAGSVRALGDGASRRLVSEDGGPAWTLEAHAWTELAAQPPGVAAGPAARGSLGGSGWLSEHGDWVMAAACRDIEIAHERPWHDGQTRGVFTACLLDELLRVPDHALAAVRWCDVMPAVQRAVQATGGQRPTLEGRIERRVFGGGWTPAPPGFAVTPTDEPGVIALGGGQLHGLEDGAEVSIDGVLARVEAATPVACRARLAAGGAIAAGARALLTSPGPAAVRTRVLVTGSGRPGSELQAALAAGGAPGAAGGAAWSWADAGPADVELRSWADRGWVLVHHDAAVREPTTDDVIAYLGDATHPAFTARVAAALAHWARYRAIRDRQAVDPELLGWIDVALRTGATPEASMRQSPDPSGVHHATDEMPLWVAIAMRRTPPTRVFAGVVLCSDDGNVVPLWPPRGGDPSAGGIGADESLPPGQTIYVGEDRHAPAWLTIRHDQQASRYTFKVVACTLPADAPPPELDSLAIARTVQEVVDQAAAGTPRDLDNVTAPTHQWCAWDLAVRVARVTVISAPLAGS